MKKYARSLSLLSIALIVLLFSQCKDEEPTIIPIAVGTPYTLQIPSGFPQSNIQSDNPLTEEGIKLGRFLFYEKALSGDGTQSCGSCHIQERAFTDVTATSVGINGDFGTRKAMPLFNLAFHDQFFWDGRSLTLEEQALIPIEDPIEMDNTLETAVARLQADPLYPPMFRAAFGSNTVSSENIGKAIAQFERTMISSNSKFDSVIRIQSGASFTALEQRGYELFTSDFDPNGGFGGDCFHCHGERETSFLFGAFGRDLQFINNGLKEVYADEGRALVTGKPEDIGKFKVPSVRNVEFAFPYMHDGSIPSLDSLIGFYNFGGHLHANIDPNMKAAGQGRNWSAGQKQALAAFLRSLSDYKFLEDTAFSDPHN
jgi:cytochrome c peroxidase